MKNLGNRMKKYENVSRHYLTRRTPVIVRVDGKSFHTLLRGITKPFDNHFIGCMQDAAVFVSKKLQGFKFGYIQSDEASFVLTDYDNLDSQGWFDYNLFKMISISAAMMSSAFNLLYRNRDPHHTGHSVPLSFFDSRAFNIPKEEVANYFLWRAKDWQRNSLSMYARSFFSHKELVNKHSSDVHEMLYSIGRNWATDLNDTLKNGTWIVDGEGAVRTDILPSYQDISKIVNPLVEVE